MPPLHHVTHLTVSADQAGRRLDNFLFKKLGLSNKILIYKKIRKGEFRVNGKRCRVSQRINAEDVIRVPPFPHHSSDQAVAPSPQLQHVLLHAILYEDDDLLILNKPAGLAVHAGSGLASGLIEAIRQLPNSGYNTLELAHRLDRQTSGCLVLCKNLAALHSFHEQLQQRQVHKAYLALLTHWPYAEQHTINQPIAHDPKHSARMTTAASGKTAITECRLLHSGTDAVLIEASPATGRKHQIRVHLASLGTPIAGDPLYGDFQWNRALLKQGLKRMFLHAHRLSFQHPANGKKLTLHAPLPDPLNNALATAGITYAQQMDRS